MQIPVRFRFKASGPTKQRFALNSKEVSIQPGDGGSIYKLNPGGYYLAWYVVGPKPTIRYSLLVSQGDKVLAQRLNVPLGGDLRSRDGEPFTVVPVGPVPQPVMVLLGAEADFDAGVEEVVVFTDEFQNAFSEFKSDEDYHYDITFE